MSKDIPLAKVWVELWNERQHLTGLPMVTGVEVGVRIDQFDNMQVFITWMQQHKFNRVEERYTRLDMERIGDAELTITRAVRTLAQMMQKKVEKMNDYDA